MTCGPTDGVHQQWCPGQTGHSRPVLKKNQAILCNIYNIFIEGNHNAYKCTILKHCYNFNRCYISSMTPKCHSQQLHLNFIHFTSPYPVYSYLDILLKINIKDQLTTIRWLQFLHCQNSHARVASPVNCVKAYDNLDRLNVTIKRWCHIQYSNMSLSRALADPEGGGVQGVLTPPPLLKFTYIFFLCDKENIMTSQEEGGYLDPRLLIFFYLCFT
jgi:hypothetical protein